MSNPITENAVKIIQTLFTLEEKFKGGEVLNLENPPYLDGKELEEYANLAVDDINDAVEYLDERSLLDRRNALGTYPFNFLEVTLNSKGRYLYHELAEKQEVVQKVSPLSPTSTVAGSLPFFPMGSPFGFIDLDWEYVFKKIREREKLFVVMGFQFKSEYYDTEKLKANIEACFQKAVEGYNKSHRSDNITLDFKPLAASYGEHLFNQITRDIISSDIAVFETSDMNANVMIEMGVALTWGTRVLPIRKAGRPKLPSDISGLTWADYAEDGTRFSNSNHEEEIIAMIERAIQKKSIRP